MENKGTRDAEAGLLRHSSQRDLTRAEAGRRRFLTAMAAGILGFRFIKIGRGSSAVSAWTGLETNSILNQARPLESASTLKIVKVEPLILRLKTPGAIRFHETRAPRGTGTTCCVVSRRKKDSSVGAKAPTFRASPPSRRKLNF